MVVLRVAFSILASANIPACISLINDYYPNEQRAKASSVYVMAVSIGICFANLTTLLDN